MTTEAGRRALSLLGLAARAGAVVPGTERVRGAAREGRLRFAIVAADAAANARDKVLPPLEASGVTFVEAYDRNALGRATGRGPLSAVGVTDASFADRIRVLLEQGSAGGASRPNGS